MKPSTTIKRDVTVLFVFLSVFLLGGLPGYSQEETLSTPYEFHAKKDLPVFGIASGAALLPVILANKVTKTCPCSPSDVNGFDRSTTTRRSDTLDKVSNGAVLGSLAWPAAAMFFDSGSRKDAIVDGLITTEAVLTNVAVNQMVKIGVHRPRPLLYGLAADDPQLQQNDNYLSFYSLHTSVVFAAGMSYATTFALRHPRSRYRWLVYTAAAGSGAAVGTLRILSGRHFPTDALTGAAAGTSMGLLIPRLHRKGSITGLSVVPTRSGAALLLQIPLG